ncbi:exosortase/archaeosortase family protein [Blastopirellula marina]|nr:exosortase/archaeosortase family protein [Blastopirellula marina]
MAKNALSSQGNSAAWRMGAVWGAIGLFILWSYWGSLSMLCHRWYNEADYSHGFFVPLFSVLLLWIRRGSFRLEFGIGSTICGAVLILAAGAMRAVSAHYYFQLLDPISLLPLLAGLVLVLGGWPSLAWSWPAIFFLGFMVPLPGFISGSLSHELQRIGTIGSVYILQTVGMPAVAQGNVIWLTEGKIGVVEACSGLRMLNVFVAMCCGAAVLLDRPLWERCLIVISALPIGVAANVLRISVTGILFETVGAEWAERVFHDMAGLLMMPLAILLLGTELYILSKLLLPPVESSVLAMNIGKGTSEEGRRSR